MTLSTTANRKAYTGDGVSTAFTFPYLFLANADVTVYVNGIKQTTGFTTTGQGVGSGTVTFTTAPANGALIVLVRIPDFLQSTALPSNGPFPSDSVERMSDKAMIGLQRFIDLADRSLVLSDGDAAATLTLPLLADRSSKFLAFDSSGLPVAASGATGLPATATGAALLAAANAAAARAVLASGLTGDALFLTATSAAARAVLGVISATTAAEGLVELATDAEAQAGTDAVRAITAANLKAAQIVLGTAVASTSGTSIDFTGIPSFAKRVTVFFIGVSTNGTSVVGVQAGTSGGVVTSGYLDSAGDVVGGTAANATSLFPTQTAGNATHVRHGKVTLERVTGNTWVATGVIGLSNTGQVHVLGGSIALAGALDRVRLTTSGGVDTFDAGTVNVSWE